MEKLIWVALIGIVVVAALVGFVGGAVAHFIGLPFWPFALGLAACILAFGMGKMSSG